MKNLFDFFGQFCDQMTLGSNKSLFFSKFAKNETKKRKSNEDMNGFMREDSLQTAIPSDLFDNERFVSSSYETPSKRSRIEVEPNMSSNHKNPKIGLFTKSFQFFQNKWNRFKRKPISDEPNSEQNSSTVSLIVENNTAFNDMMPSSSGTINTANNQTIATKHEILLLNTNSLSEKPNSFMSRKRRLTNYMNLNEKMRYKLLLSRHTPQAMVQKNLIRQENSPPVIDLTICEKKTSHESQSQQLCRTETLNNNSKNNLIDRIKSQGLIKNSNPIPPKTTTTKSRPLFTALYEKNKELISFPSMHSTPKLSFFNQTLAITESKNLQTLDCFEKTVSIPSLPESSKKFNNLIETKKDYLSSDFVSDLRSSLLKSTQSDEQKILKSESFLNECQIKRQTDCQSLSDKFKKPITRTELLPFTPFIAYDDKEDEEEEEEDEDETSPSDFPVLTPDMNREIDAALKSTPPNQILSESFAIQICRKDMETLKGLNWLNDEIINFYLSLIVERGKNDNFPTVHAFNTFFYKKLKDNGPQSLKRWTKKLDIFANDFIFIPIHLGMHWCLAVIDFINKKIEYYDSMGGNNFECLQALKSWLQAESLDKKKYEFPMSDWTLQMAKDIPQQMNGSDCGMFSCKFAEYVSRKARINFTQAHMPYFRRRMVYEILTKQLL